MRIECLDETQLQKLLKLERECFSTPWSEDSLKSLLSFERAQILGLFEGDSLLGYSCLEWVLDEGNLTNIAVSVAARRRGCGSLLMEKTLSLAKEKELCVIFLEVRASNEGAINLYKKYGFEEVGMRKNYYSEPVEDAILMTLSIE